MKKILFILFILFSIGCNAQIYNTIKHYDKFDDVIKTEKIKTRISFIPEQELYNFRVGGITIETKGKYKEEYLYISKFEHGTNDSIINIIDNIYGYETEYYCFNIKDSTYIVENIIKPYYSKMINNVEFINNIQDMYEQSNKKVDLNTFIMDFLNIGFKLYLIYLEDEHLIKFNDRIITTQYTYSFINRLCWIEKNDGSRIIYSNE